MRAAKSPSATARTVSLFTGKTDSEAPNSRDGSAPDPVSDYNKIEFRPRYKWKRYQLTEYSCDALNAMISVTRRGPGRDGAWVYNVIKTGKSLGYFDDICAAADAAEGIER